MTSCFVYRLLRRRFRTRAHVTVAAARAYVPAFIRARERAGRAGRASAARRGARGGVVGRGAPGLAEGTRRVLRVRGALVTSVGFLARQLARGAPG